MRVFPLIRTLFFAVALFGAEKALPPGATIAVRTIDPIDSGSADVGKTFRASLDAPLLLDGKEAAPKGADAVLRIIEAISAGKIQGKASLTVSLVSISSGQDTFQATDTTVSIESAGKGKGSAKRIGIGAAGGAALGGILGGGKGAAIGAGAGAGVGAAASMLTGPQVKVPAETVLTFKVR